MEKVVPASAAAPKGTVDALAIIGNVPLFQHLVPREHVMPERDWLGGLQMGEAGHDRLRFAFRDIDQRGLQAAKFATIASVSCADTDGCRLPSYRRPCAACQSRYDCEF